uniref:VanZ-like domain-containing protein n=1 Tax=Rhodotorula toruloides TaxID=5286 RepID=A0A0K3CQU9_RHOTO
MRAPIRLPSERSSNPLAQSWARLKRVRGLRDLHAWSLRSFPLGDLPLRIRPVFVVYTFLTLVVLSLLGFHPTLAHHLAPPSVPFSDKVLHFVCFFCATALFYTCWVVEEQARRVWFWRWWNELSSAVVCLGFGGILSEFVQALLPSHTFQPGDILANLLGSSLAIFICSHYSRERRRERELRRLYDEEEREMEEGRKQGGTEERRLASVASGSGSRAQRKEAQDPWSAREDEIFGLGGDDEDDEPVPAARRRDDGSL